MLIMLVAEDFFNKQLMVGLIAWRGPSVLHLCFMSYVREPLLKGKAQYS